MNSPAVIALGSNLVDPRRNLLRAFDRLQELSDSRLVKSSLWSTPPIDCPAGSPDFLNAVTLLEPRSGETPESLLRKLRALEAEFGRPQKRIVNEARPLDLDLIAFGNETRATQDLTLPHPRAHLRRFVLEPLNEIAPELILPGQVRSVAELLAQLPPDSRVRRVPAG